MADTSQNSPGARGKDTEASKPKITGPTKYQQLNKLYSLPVPLRTFPLPTFVPHNPLSLFHILYTWLSQTIQPQSSHFETPYCGWWSPETRSVHVTDARSTRGLWEQGFFGKGSLSRSEPSWLNREKTRRGLKPKNTAEEVTRQRRIERQQVKWERARKEREAIDQTLLEEANVAWLGIDGHAKPTQLVALIDEQASSKILEKPTLQKEPHLRRVLAPVGPLEILALPNSHKDCLFFQGSMGSFDNGDGFEDVAHAAVEGLDIGIGHDALEQRNNHGMVNGLGINGHSKPSYVSTEEIDTKGDDTTTSTHSDDTGDIKHTPNGPALANGSPGTANIKRQKSVRFSPTVEKNTFIQSEPPSPERGATRTAKIEEAPLVIQNQEHFQLTLQEAFFLSYGLGALTILDPDTKSPISNRDLFTLFRKSSYFPPRANPGLAPDDPFMINYIVYHHFRSLGWVVRGGIKFSVDYMLYNRGPVFSHAEFAVIILPSYSDPYWRSDAFLQSYVKSKETRSWSWMHCINRVISQVKKTLILVYVDIPPPLDPDEEEKMVVDKILGRYKVREIIMKRWLSNRMRD